ncbi:VTC domain-containing protein [Micropruina sp.]|uniref:VTC domain-containing protein n=1 Tax=Micropruina sp. TaxID=2737536 RepID=UPI0039E6C408
MITSSETALDSIRTIDLDELIAGRPLLTRVHRRYVLSAADAAMALELVDPTTTRVLEVDGRRDLGHTSVYLDTPELDAFRRAARGRRHRFRIRTRRYESGGTFLEVRTRQQQRTVPHRLPGEHLPDGGFSEAGARFVAETLRGAGVRNPPIAELRASLRADYRRITLLHEPTTSRITIDSGLTWWDVRTGSWLSRPELAIIETRSAGQPCGMDLLLSSLGHRPARFSKYATALAAMNPRLPATRWRRTLRQYF